MEQEVWYDINQHRRLNKMQTNNIASISKRHQEKKTLKSTCLSSNNCYYPLQHRNVAEPVQRLTCLHHRSFIVWVSVGESGCEAGAGGDWYHPYLHFNTGPILFMPLLLFRHLWRSQPPVTQISLPFHHNNEGLRPHAPQNKCSSTGEADTREKKTGLVASFREGSINHKSTWVLHKIW